MIIAEINKRSVSYRSRGNCCLVHHEWFRKVQTIEFIEFVLIKFENIIFTQSCSFLRCTRHQIKWTPYPGLIERDKQERDKHRINFFDSQIIKTNRDRVNVPMSGLLRYNLLIVNNIPFRTWLPRSSDTLIRRCNWSRRCTRKSMRRWRKLIRWGNFSSSRPCWFSGTRVLRTIELCEKVSKSWHNLNYIFQLLS